MTKLLIFIGEGQTFNVEVTVGAIFAMRGVTEARSGNFIGSVFECKYHYAGASTLVRLSQDTETVIAEGIGMSALHFALELQRALSVDLHAIDMEYSFNLALRDFQTVEQLQQAIS